MTKSGFDAFDHAGFDDVESPTNWHSEPVLPVGDNIRRQ